MYWVWRGGGGGGGGVQLAMTYHYFSFLIAEIWLDQRGGILLGIILFYVLEKYNLISRM